VDIGPATIRDYADAGEGITTLTNRTCWGASTAGDSSCFKEAKAKTADVDYTVVSRGWADLGNHASDGKGSPLTPGKRYTITLDLAATDHVVPKGHRLALIVAGTDQGLIDPPADTPKLALDLSRTSAGVPFVGGPAAFARATAGAALTTPVATLLDGVREPRTTHRVPEGTQ
jgi:X-Pro dipeptidyl-peptidase